MELLLSQFINGLSNSAELFIIAVGLFIIFGMLDVVNMAHGEMIMLGAYCGCVCVTDLHLPFALALVASFVFTALIGVLIERVLIKRFYGKVAETLLLTFALTYVIQQIVRSIFGPENQKLEMPISGRLTFGNVTIPYYNIFLIAMALLILAATLVLFYRTNFGKQLRAITQNRSMSQCLGVNSDKIDCLTFAYGSGLAGLAGALIAPLNSVSPGMGSEYVVDSLLTVILGGLNSVLGSFFGSGVIQESVTIISGYISLVTARLLIFVAIIVIIRFKPQGLFASRERR